MLLIVISVQREVVVIMYRFSHISLLLPAAVNTCGFFGMRASELIQQLLNWCFAEASFWWRGRTFQKSQCQKRTCWDSVHANSWGREMGFGLKGSSWGEMTEKSLTSMRNSVGYWNQPCVEWKRHMPLRQVGKRGLLAFGLSCGNHFGCLAKVCFRCLGSRAVNASRKKY